MQQDAQTGFRRMPQDASCLTGCILRVFSRNLAASCEHPVSCENPAGCGLLVTALYLTK
jgi:hypothetical protein